MSEMWVVMVGFAHHQQHYELMFNVESRAKAAYQTLRAKDRGEDDFEIEATDDYGQTVMVNRDEVAVIMLRDLGRVHAGQGEIALMQGKAQAVMQRKAQSDPAMRVMGLQGAPPGMRLG